MSAGDRAHQISAAYKNCSYCFQETLQIYYISKIYGNIQNIQRSKTTYLTYLLLNLRIQDVYTDQVPSNSAMIKKAIFPSHIVSQLL